MKRKSVLGIVSVGLFLALPAVPAFSQATNGDITGRVVDAPRAARCPVSR